MKPTVQMYIFSFRFSPLGKPFPCGESLFPTPTQLVHSLSCLGKRVNISRVGKGWIWVYECPQTYMFVGVHKRTMQMTPCNTHFLPIVWDFLLQISPLSCREIWSKSTGLLGILLRISRRRNWDTLVNYAPSVSLLDNCIPSRSTEALHMVQPHKAHMSRDCQSY